jgi:hypothetical protein
MKGLILILQSRNCSKIKCKWNWLLWPLLGCIWTKIHVWQWSTTLTILNLEFHNTFFIDKLTFPFPWILFATGEECFESTFCLLAKFRQKMNLKIQIFKNGVILEVVNMKKWEKKIVNIYRLGFKCVAMSIKSHLNKLATNSICSQIWLNFLRDDCHISYIKKIQKKHWLWF